MHDIEQDSEVSDGPYILLGGVLGLFAGALLGGLLLLLLEDTLSEVSLIFLVHTMVAMMFMGGWTAPSLMRGEA